MPGKVPSLARQSGGTPHGEPAHKAEGAVVAVVTARDEAGEFLIRTLQRLRLQVRHVWPSTDTLPADADVVYCDYAADLTHRLPWPIGEASAALVVILPQRDPFSSGSLEAATPNAILARPFTTNAIEASLAMARSQFRYEQRLRSKSTRLEENLRSMRTIERAKRFLMASRAMGDEEAYTYIRSEAMARRMAVSAVAEAIVASFEFFGGKPTP